MESTAALPALIESLRDTDISVAIQAAQSLTSIGAAASAAIPVMTDLLGSDDENVRGYMAAALGRFGPLAASAVPGLLQLLHDKEKCLFQGKRRNYPVRFRAAFAIADIAPEREEIIAVLREAMRYPQFHYAQAEAFDVIGRLGSRAKVFIPELLLWKTTRTLSGADAQMTLAAWIRITRSRTQSPCAALAMLAREGDQEKHTR